LATPIPPEADLFYVFLSNIEDACEKLLYPKIARR